MMFKINEDTLCTLNGTMSAGQVHSSSGALSHLWPVWSAAAKDQFGDTEVLDFLAGGGEVDPSPSCLGLMSK